MRKFIESLQSHGRYTFTKSEALLSMECSQDAFRMAVSRAQKSGQIVQPKQGFFVVVPVEYRSAKTLPASWFVDALMNYVECDYYVGLLSAAAIQGAAHQQPQIFQVITNKRIRKITIGRASIDFIYKKNWPEHWVEKTKTNTGRMKISVPAATALDILRYPEHSGYIDNIATVISELSDRLRPDDLEKLLDDEFCQKATVQRLGYILDRIQKDNLSKVVTSWLNGKILKYVPLLPGSNEEALERSTKWHLEINHHIDEDI